MIPWNATDNVDTCCHKQQDLVTVNGPSNYCCLFESRLYKCFARMEDSLSMCLDRHVSEWTIDEHNNILNNIIFHAGLQGVLVCGQLYPLLKKLCRRELSYIKGRSWTISATQNKISRASTRRSAFTFGCSL